MQRKDEIRELGERRIARVDEREQARARFARALCGREQVGALAGLRNRHEERVLEVRLRGIDRAY